MKTPWIVAASMVLLGARPAGADATSDLWTALKAANDKDALAAIAKGPDLKKLDPAFGTPLNYASCFAGGEVIKALIDAKSEVNFVAPANGHTPLVNAASWGNTEAVKLLLAAGAGVKGKTKVGMTFLAVAMTGSKLEIVKLFVDAGADPGEKYRLAGLPYDLNLLNALLSVYSPSEKVKNLAANAPNLAKVGITFPARLKDAKESDFTPLQEMAKYILEKGAFDPNQKVPGTWGCILNQAIDLQKEGVVQALIDAKASFETPMTILAKMTSIKATPLMVAASKGNNAIVEMLLKAGAKANGVVVERGNETGDANTYVVASSKTPYTAVSVALLNNHPDTAALLRKAGGLIPSEMK